MPQELERLARHDPRAVFALALVWQAQGDEFPEHILKTAVATAVQPPVSWEQAEAAIRGFDLYKERAWAREVFAPFIATYATQILANAAWFSRWHQAWTTGTIADLASPMPALVLSELQRLAEVDARWARHLAETIMSTTPTLTFAHAKTLLAVDRHWAQGVLQSAIARHPRKAMAAAQTLLAAPEGQQLFDSAALTDPRWAVGVASARLQESPAVMAALQRSRNPYVRTLAQMAQSLYPDERKGRLALFVQDVTDKRLSLEEALHLSSNDREYFRLLVTMTLQARHPRPSALEFTLKEEVWLLIERLNGLHDQPEAVRFRAVEAFSAEELYVLITYGEADLFTSTYQGLFDRLLAKMRTARLTGDQLLARVNDLHVRVFVKAAAVFNRLAAFLATIPAPVARWSLLVRCLENLDQGPEVTLPAMTAAELLEAPLDPHSLRLMRDTLKNEYFRAEREQRRHAQVIYGLLAARFADRSPPPLYGADFAAIVQRYRPYLPTLTGLSAAQLFERGRSIHQYFFYDDDDGKVSFSSFLAQYQRAKGWSIQDKGAFVQVVSASTQRRIEIYANKPLYSEAGTREIDHLMQQDGVAPRVIVHRGHSSAVDRTLMQIPATVVLVFLGSCGGYSQLEAILSRAPAAHVIATKGIGCHTVNDRLLKALNDYLLSGKELIWADFWRYAGAALADNSRFMDYVSPDKNVGMIFLKAYRALTGQRQAAPLPAG
jgi:hypothetical protein